MMQKSHYSTVALPQQASHRIGMGLQPVTLALGIKHCHVIERPFSNMCRSDNHLIPTGL